MERIILEVDDKLAKAWRRASDKKKKEISNKFNLSLAEELINASSGKSEHESNEYIEFLDELRKEMADKGLTQEKLDDIMNDV